ncbi:hypothetical protein LINPERHAP1_LOCUS7477 [Linum perenne]
MASIWQPARGVQIQDLGEKLILFSFFHQKDLRWVVEGRALDVRPGEQPLQADLLHVDFWVQVYDLSVGFFSEQVARVLGDFVGSFVTYDSKTG